MAESKKKSNTAAKKSTPKPKVEPVEAVEEVVAPAPVEEKKPAHPVKKKLPRPDLNDLVEVESCFHGQLNFVSEKTGRRASWGKFGDVDYLTVEDLMSMRNAHPGFFKNNWIMLVGDNAEAVFEYLQLGRYYKNYRSREDFDELFNMEPDALKEVLDTMSSDAKENVARHAYALINDGELDSNRVIDVIEKATGFELRD